MAKLTDKQKRFVDEYIVDCNATQAAIRAGYSEKTADRIGHQNLRKLEISKAIQERMETKQKETIMQQDEVLELLTSIARGEEQRYKSTKHKKANGKEDKSETSGTSTPQTEERLKALELIGKRYALFTEKQQVDVIDQVQFVDDIGDEDEDD